MMRQLTFFQGARTERGYDMESFLTHHLGPVDILLGSTLACIACACDQPDESAFVDGAYASTRALARLVLDSFDLRSWPASNEYLDSFGREGYVR